MPKLEMTDRFCRSAKAAGGRQTEYFDAVVKGLSLTASPGGTKTFYLHYTRPGDGRRARLKIGRFPEIALAKAREKARDVRGEVSEGQDPIVDKRAHAASETVADLVENYIARHAAGKRTADAIGRRLRKNVKDVIGDVKLADLHRRDITRCIDAVSDRGAPIEANRVFEDVRSMIRWARGRGDLDVNLVEGMRKPSETKVRDRVLTADEIRTMWAALASANMRESTRRIVRLCLVVGARVGEICGMQRGELDMAKALWVIPGERTKNGETHTIPLSSMALAIIRDQLVDVDELDRRKGREPSSFVFPGPGARAPITGHAVAKAVKREERARKGKPSLIMGIEPWSPHDLRRTMATHLEESGISPFIVGHILNHVSITKATVTSKVYARYDYGKEKSAALNLWSDRLAAIIEGKSAAVVAMARA